MVTLRFVVPRPLCINQTVGKGHLHTIILFTIHPKLYTHTTYYMYNIIYIYIYAYLYTCMYIYIYVYIYIYSLYIYTQYIVHNCIQYHSRTSLVHPMNHPSIHSQGPSWWRIPSAKRDASGSRSAQEPGRAFLGAVDRNWFTKKKKQPTHIDGLIMVNNA